MGIFLTRGDTEQIPTLSPHPKSHVSGPPLHSVALYFFGGTPPESHVLSLSTGSREVSVLAITAEG